MNREGRCLVVSGEASVVRGVRGRMENAMRLRVLAAAGVLVSAAVHLKLWLDGFATSRHRAGILLNAVGGLVIACCWSRGGTGSLVLALGFGISTLGAYLISATVGLFGVHEVWTGVWVITAEVSEVVAIVASVLALRKERPWPSVGQSQHRLGLRRAHLH